MPKTKHVHHLALRVKPRPALLEVWCPGCGEGLYTVEPTEDTAVELLSGKLVLSKGLRRRRSDKRGKA